MRKIIITCTMAALLVVGGCKKFIDVNQDPNSLVDVPESLILTPTQLNLTSNIVAGSPLTNAPIIVNHWLQTVALNQSLPNSGTYYQLNVDFDADWSNIYSLGLNNLNVIKQKAAANGNFNYGGIAKILTAYYYASATDLWGDVPQSEALKGIENFKPAYDKQEDVYKYIQSQLDEGLADIANGGGSKVAGDDLFYGGDMAKWTKLAYTLKARYYMHLTNAPGYNAATQADLALTALQKGFMDNGDNMALAYTGAAGQENPIYLAFLPVSTLVLSSHLVNLLKTRNDPRLTKLVALSPSGIYNGRDIGDPDGGDLLTYSVPGSFYGSASSSVYVTTYSEALFIKAEATLIKSGFAAAEPIYQEGIKSNLSLLGITTNAANTYLASRGTLSAANALQLIMEEKSVADFLSLENFNDWRRTGFPALVKVQNALSEIPRRALYPQSELIANPQAQQSAKLTGRVWWDK